MERSALYDCQSSCQTSSSTSLPNEMDAAYPWPPFATVVGPGDATANRSPSGADSFATWILRMDSLLQVCELLTWLDSNAAVELIRSAAQSDSEEQILVQVPISFEAGHRQHDYPCRGQ